MLVVGGRIVDGDVDGSGAFFDRNPRTAVASRTRGSCSSSWWTAGRAPTAGA
jgi:hypothetical protein